MRTGLAGSATAATTVCSAGRAKSRKLAPSRAAWCWGLASVEFSTPETASAIVRMLLERDGPAGAGPSMTAAVCQPRGLSDDWTRRASSARAYPVWADRRRRGGLRSFDGPALTPSTQRTAPASTRDVLMRSCGTDRRRPSTGPPASRRPPGICRGVGNCRFRRWACGCAGSPRTSSSRGG